MVCRAAVKIIDLRQNGKEVTIPCHRHCDAFQILHDFGYKREDYKEVAQGFLDEHDNFMTRLEAMDHAIKTGQIDLHYCHVSPIGKELYSEDLW